MGYLDCTDFLLAMVRCLSLHVTLMCKVVLYKGKPNLWTQVFIFEIEMKNIQIAVVASKKMQ